MSQLNENTPTTDVELDLSYTQGLRKRLIKELTKKTIAPPEGSAPGTLAVEVPGEVHVPNESSEKTMLIQLLDGVDRQALGRMKVAVEANATQGVAQANAALIKELITGGHLKDHAIVPGAGTIPQLPANTPLPDLIPGQLEATGSGENWRDFQQRQAVAEGRAVDPSVRS